MYSAQRSFFNYFEKKNRRLIWVIENIYFKKWKLKKYGLERFRTRASRHAKILQQITKGSADMTFGACHLTSVCNSTCDTSTAHSVVYNTYRLLDVLLYNTGIYLDEYTAWKVIFDEPLVDAH